jgi:hypothetical protein
MTHVDKLIGVALSEADLTAAFRAFREAGR